LDAPPYPSSPRRLAIVPARGGSKGVPGKNLAIVGGESLTARAVRCARESGLFDRIVVSTDDAAVAEEGRRAGADVPGLRPPALAGDNAAVIDAVRHLLATLSESGEQGFDLVALLEPTSPMRTAAIVAEVVRAAEAPGVDAALTLSPVPVRYHPFKQFLLTGDGTVSFAAEGGRAVANRQELGRSWIRNGLCYAVRTTSLDRGFGILGERARGVLHEGPVVNIDDPEDLAEARRLLGP
jgi:CMP-N,N'-diacetyllegionaminic acid synthase